MLKLQFFTSGGSIVDQKTLEDDLAKVKAHGHLLLRNSSLAQWAPNLPPVVGFMVRDFDGNLLYEWPESPEA